MFLKEVSVGGGARKSLEATTYICQSGLEQRCAWEGTAPHLQPAQLKKAAVSSFQYAPKPGGHRKPWPHRAETLPLPGQPVPKRPKSCVAPIPTACCSTKKHSLRIQQFSLQLEDKSLRVALSKKSAADQQLRPCLHLFLIILICFSGSERSGPLACIRSRLMLCSQTLHAYPPNP